MSGDGICCGYGIGNYNISDDQGNIIIASDGVFGNSQVNSFCADNSCGTVTVDSMELDRIPVTLTITLDDFPEETLWSIVDDAGNTIAADGPYSSDSPGAIIQEEICLDPTACFTFTIRDLAGDGICCGYGIGNYNITDPNGNVLVVSDGTFTNSESTNFCAVPKCTPVMVDSMMINLVPITLTLNLDDFPEETLWTLTDEAGNIIGEDGPYTSAAPGTTIQEEFCLDPSACFTFTITDLADDGICCGYGLGDYNFTDALGNVLVASDGQFGSSETNSFCIDDICGAAMMNSMDINIVPITLTLNLDDFAEETLWTLTDEAGNTIGEDGPYASSLSGTTIQETFCLDSTQCYIFTITDLAGDGICCGFGLGDYNFTDASGNVLASSSGIFGSTETNRFCADNSCGTITVDSMVMDRVPVTLNLNLDDFPEETLWTLVDNTGTTIGAGGPYSSAPVGGVQEVFCLDPTACFTFTITDLANDGICCGYGLGDYNFTDAEGNVIVSSDGQFGNGETIEFCGDLRCTFTVDVDVTGPSSAEAQDGSILITAANASGTVSYSIDNGQSFQENPLFDNLPMGTYAILVEDERGCSFEDSINLDITISNDEIDNPQFFKVFPNPTDGIFNLEVSGLDHSSVFLDIEIYNTSGQQVQKTTLGKFGNVYKGQVSLYHYPPGMYLIRFASDDISRMARVVRL